MGDLVEFPGEHALLQVSDAVLPGDGASEVECHLKDVVECLHRPTAGIGVAALGDDRRMQVAVAGMAEGADRHLPLGGDVLDSPKRLGEARPRHRDVVEQSVPRLLDGEDRHPPRTEQQLRFLGGLGSMYLAGTGPFGDRNEPIGVDLRGTGPVVELGHEDTAS